MTRTRIIDTTTYAQPVALYAFPEAGCFLGMVDGTLVSCPMWADGSPDRENLGDVENFEGLDMTSVNIFFERVNMGAL